MFRFLSFSKILFLLNALLYL